MSEKNTLKEIDSVELEKWGKNLETQPIIFIFIMIHVNV
jgi:hypothetical protein